MFNKVMNKVNTLTLTASAMLVASTTASLANTETTAAKGILGVSKNLETQIDGVKTLLTTGAGFVGLVLVIFALIGFKNHTENPQQHPLKNSLVKFVIGAIMMMPFGALQMSSETVGAAKNDGGTFKTEFNKDWSTK